MYGTFRFFTGACFGLASFITLSFTFLQPASNVAQQTATPTARPIDIHQLKPLLTINLPRSQCFIEWRSPQSITTLGDSCSGSRIYPFYATYTWDPITGELVELKEMIMGDIVVQPTAAPDGKLVAYGSAFTDTFEIAIRMPQETSERDQPITRQSDGVVQFLEGHTAWVGHFLWLPDSTILISAGMDGVILRWDALTGELLTQINAHEGAIYQIVWTPDQRYVVSAGGDNSIRFWDVETGELIHSLEGHTGAVYDLAWSPDGTQLASTSADETLRIWGIPSQ